MKSKKNFILLLVMVFAFALISCDNGNGGGNDISETRAREIIEPFYDLFRSPVRNANPDLVWERGMDVLHDNWLSYDGNPPPYGTTVPRGKIETRGFLEGYMFVNIPDINVNIISVQVDGNWIFVRSQLTGTFIGPDYFGFPVGPYPFGIIALDYHRFDNNGKLVELYHSEHWAEAVMQSYTR